ncbi:MAG: hypothetical protein M3132_06105 [Actinomycetia bacterium]|nr:hypothetical protein [Actinomycetes bacterium]
MLIWVVIAIAVVAGATPPLTGAAVLVGFQPLVGVGVLAGFSLWQRHRTREHVAPDEVAFLRYLASAVTAGTSLRNAIRAGDSSIVSPRTRLMCDAGRPVGDIGGSIASNLPTNGAAFAAVCSLAEQAGSRLAPTLHAMADRADDVSSAKRRQRVATTQARYSAGVVGVAPLVVTALVLVVGGIPDSPGAWVVVPVVVGVGLQVFGLAVVYLLATGQRQ